MMSAKVQNVCRVSQQIFSSFLPKKSSTKQQSKLDTKDVEKLEKNLSRITLNDIYYDLNELDPDNYLNQTNRYPAPITFTSLFENQYFSLTVFGFRRRTSVIPLHDHPDMHGFIKCVHGCLSIKSYDILNLLLLDIPSQILDKVPSVHHHCLVPSKYLGEDIVSSDSYEVAKLTPTERNIHEITPLTTMAVMADIIAPPYTDLTHCHYYSIVDTVFDQKSQLNVTWLLKSLQNYDYCCDTLTYRGPQIVV